MLRFLAAGLANTGFGYAAYAAFVLLGAPLAVAVAGATGLGFLFNFLSYGGFVFGSTSHRLLPRFLLFYLALGGLNFLLLRVLGGIGAGPLLAQALLLPVLATCGYLGMRSFVFRGQAQGLRHEVPMPSMPAAEEFKPIPIARGEGALGRILFSLRMVVDLQLLTCVRFLAPILADMHGSVLDVGCGEMPFRGLLPPDARYTGIDVPAAGEFGMQRHAEIVDFDGLHIPFADGSFDHILCTEVLEHAEDPAGLLAEMLRVLRPGGTLAATVPFSARVHHAPHDHHRFTRYRLAAMFAGFGEVTVSERGDDLAVIANKLIVVCMRLVQPSGALPWRLPLLLLAGPAALIALGIAHLSIRLGWGSAADPLGYGILARKA